MANHRRSRLTIIFFKNLLTILFSFHFKHHEKTTAKTRWILSLESLKSLGKALCKGFTQAKNDTFTREKGNGTTTKTPPWDKYSDEAVDSFNICDVNVSIFFIRVNSPFPISSLKDSILTYAFSHLSIRR